MVQYSKQDLDTKIHTFMKKKMHQFPELEDEPYVLDHQETEWREARQLKTSGRLPIFPKIRLSSHY